MTSKTIEFLRRDEWTMGNGQCGECCGLGTGFLHGSFGGHEDVGRIGHRPACALALSLEELGEEVLWMGELDHYLTPKQRTKYLKSKAAHAVWMRDFWAGRWEDKL